LTAFSIGRTTPDLAQLGRHPVLPPHHRPDGKRSDAYPLSLRLEAVAPILTGKAVLEKLSTI
jgi:hypothetical protein